MSFQELELKSDYDSEDDDVLNDFYIPVLSRSKRYDRLAGFFSSSVLAAAAKGIAPFIQNGGAMRLIVGATLQKSDVDAIKLGHENPEKILAEMMLKHFEDIYEELIKDHVRALAWLVARNQLEIRVAMVVDDAGFPLDQDTALKTGIFHQKVGILEDNEGNTISFSGSINESATSWESNIEEFKVFRSWIDGERDHLIADKAKFEKYWFGKTRRVKIMDVPSAVRERLIRIAPNNIGELKLERFYRKPILREYQIRAISLWMENGKKGIFEMATGTGKTYTAIGCIMELLEDEKRLFVVIACPFTHLIKQWKDNLVKFGLSGYEIFGAFVSWENRLANVIFDFNSGIYDIIVVITTHDTFANDKFIRLIEKVKSNCFLIVDEVHGVGSIERRKGLLDNYHFRLGLSATPIRWLDEEGTSLIFNFFDKVVFNLPLHQAIEKGFLCKYEYRPFLVELTYDELEEYRKLTKKISIEYARAKDDKEKKEIFKLYCILRHRVIVNASMKYTVLNKILDELKDIKHCLIYCSPQQIDIVQEILNKRGIIQHKFTAEEDTKERKVLLDSFAKGVYRVLVAMKCLDEGVDVPSTRIAVMMASSTNPREFIQRRGRVLRPFSGKEKAIIYDIIVVPDLSGRIDPALFDLEAKILQSEIRRYTEFANAAINCGEAYLRILDLASKYHIILEDSYGNP
ncbi:MAG: DEAD/DEAH box helicase family protein [Candidatus Jordarchaeaceae archaeon]